MKIAGIILVVLGLLGFVLGGITFTETEEILDVGPIEVQAEEEHTIPIAPLASGAAVVAGLVLIVVGARAGKSS